MLSPFSRLAFLLGFAFVATISVAQENKPNVVMILSDDQAWGDYSFMGHEAIQTPHLDQLAAESLTFTRGYVPTSLCRPSLSTIITGLYPHQHGVVGNDPPWAGMKEGNKRPNHTQPEYVKNREAYLQHIDNMKTLPEYLAPLGYRSLQTGKWWEGNYKRGGFSEGMTHGDFTKDGRHGDKGLQIGRTGMKPIESFLDSCKENDDPFFVWYAPFLPHTPHNPPQRILDKYTSKTDSLPMAKYWAMCEWFDETCGELFASLEDRGLAENTIVIYVTDNGWINDRTASRYAPRSKRSPNEGGTRTPIMIKWPGHVTPQLDKQTLASSIDLVPTVLAAVGVETDRNLPGINLLNKSKRESRDALFGEIFEHDIQSMDDPAASLRYRWMIQGDWKLILPSSRMQGEKPELYNLKQDPHENNDLAAEHPQKVKSMTDAINAWWDAQ
ncbi:sulfatase atsG [Rhodopirellula maiorica SM1]|uniref:Sulfatase atsG n=1 Tax=Rhodopirellula maiorica SM1 TaxID=1265738 RepID=M5RZ47_9BACT|nr:sulfatase [Rhodopirellula maiorica]EMI20672.1 sulfatase atsG [Rhodopirellula maiorica SM1]